MVLKLDIIDLGNCLFQKSYSKKSYNRTKRIDYNLEEEKTMSQKKGVKNLRIAMKRLSEKGFIVFDVSNQVEKGFPDLMAIKEGKVSFIEVKGAKHKVHKHQMNIQRRLKESGFQVSVVVVDE